MKRRGKMWLMAWGAAGMLGLATTAFADNSKGTVTAPAPTPTPEAGLARESDAAWTVQKLHRRNNTEIQAAKIERAGGESQKVKSFATEIMRDHERADRRLAAYASQNKIALTGTGEKDGDNTGASDDTDDVQMQATLAQLRGLKGAELDRAFVSAMVVGHDKTIDMVRGARSSANDRRLITILDEFGPTLDKHRRMAAALNNTLSGTSSR